MDLGARLAYFSLSIFLSPLMKRTLLFTLALLFAVPAASAQTTIGLRAGLNTAFWTGTDADGTDPRLGFTGGLAARYAASPSFGIQGEVLYSQKGVQEPEIGTYKLDDVDVSVLGRVAIPVSPFADAGVFVGPTASVPVSSTFDNDGSAEDIDLETKTAFGITFGADYYAGPVGVDLRYTTGLSDVFGDADALDIRSQVFAVTLGYRFGG
jgi:hypothetical protein